MKIISFIKNYKTTIKGQALLLNKTIYIMCLLFYFFVFKAIFFQFIFIKESEARGKTK